MTETQGAKEEAVSALELETGKTIWTQKWSGAMQVPFFARSNGDWIRSTPVCDGQSLFIGGMKDLLVAMDCQSGQEKWRIDFPKELQSELPTFGFVCSPLVDDGRLYVQAGGGCVALECSTGNSLHTAW